MVTELQELGQLCGGARLVQELVLKKLLGRGAALHVGAQAHGQEALELAAELFRLLERRCAVCGDHVQGLQRFFVQVWWLILNHLNRHDTQRPNVDLGVILLLLDHLWGHQ